MNDRVERLRAVLEEPLLVTGPVNVRYLAGFSSSNAALLVEPERVCLFSDFRYAERARAVEGVEFEETRRNLLADLAGRLSGRVGFEAEHLSYAGHGTLAGEGLELVPHRGLVEALRAVKDEGELALVRRAAGVADLALHRLIEEGFVGRSERELAWHLEQLLHDSGAEGLSFPVIVAAGANAANPHAEPGDRPVERGEAVLVDWGCTVGGYCSDCTRTFATGPLAPRLAEAYGVCLEAQRTALEAVRPGAGLRAVDALARDRVAAAGLGERFRHGLGHGVGLAVHEAPTLSQEGAGTLTAGNVVTVEPGIYLEGLGGIRIEDLVIVAEEGPETLTPFTKELVTVG